MKLEQNTPEWMDWRRSRYSASEAPIIIGCAPSYWQTRTPDQLRLLKRGELEQKVSDYTRKIWQYGHDTESVARKEVLGNNYKPVCVETDDGVFSASLDAYDPSDHYLWAEIKCPFMKQRSKLWQKLELSVREEMDGAAPVPSRDIIPDYVWWQMVHQSYVLFRDEGDWKDASGKVYEGVLVVYIDTVNYITLSVSVDEFVADWPLLEEQWSANLALN